MGRALRKAGACHLTCPFPPLARRYRYQAFWLTQGLAEWQAERLAGDQERRGGQYADPAWVSGRLAQLEAVLPGPVPPLLYEDSDLLDPTKGDPEK